MIKDLQLAKGTANRACAQVCIIGAGTAGIFLAHQLRQQGLSVVVLEAGGNVARNPAEVDQTCEQRGIRYRGADLGRSFGLGGTSALWGGQLIPLTRADLDARREVGFEPWPIKFDEIAAYFPAVRKSLGLSDAVAGNEMLDSAVLKRLFPALQKFGAGFDLRLSTWLPFKKRNFAKGFSQMLGEDADLNVWLNASVTDMSPAQAAGHAIVETVTAKSASGQTLNVQADIFVVCSGALESTRLLLAFDESTGGAVTAGGAPLGQYFSDHLSVPCGRFAVRSWRKFNLAVGAIFQHGLMRTPRLELAPKTQQSKSLTSAFAHFTFMTHGDTGFDVVRNVLRRRQGERRQLGLTPMLIGRVVTDVAAMVFWKLVYKRLWIPRRADMLLQIDIEQVPNPNSRLTLSQDLDALGRKRLVIDWGITPEDVRVIRKVADLTVAAWKQSPLHETADLQLTLPEQFDRFETLYDVYHPTGSIRMGTSPANSVVDKDLRLWAAANCYVSTTAVFPSAGSANPGLMHLALTARLAERIGQRLNKAAA